jgi:hypothetical protein
LEGKGLKVKISKLAMDYLSCDINIDPEKTQAWIGQTTYYIQIVIGLAIKTTRKSVTGFIVFCQDAPILWRFQTQKAVSMSTSKAEYYAVLEAAKEIKFRVQELESLHINIHKPISAHIDNIGAIFIAETPLATKHTRHIDGRYPFTREYIIDSVITIIFVS